MAKKPKTMSKQDTIKAARKLQALYRKHLKKKLTIKELTEMLMYLRDEYVSVAYSNSILTVQTENIAGDGYYNSKSLGPAIIIIHLKEILTHKVYLEGRIYIKTPTNVSFPHRHVMSTNSDLCFGDAYSVCKKSIEEGRLDDCVDVIQQVLRT